MRTKALLLAGICLLAFTAFVVAGERPWMDMANCDFCKPWMESGLMKEMTHDQYTTTSGCVTVCTVPTAKIDTYRKNSAMMNVLGAKAAKGEKVNMCMSCETMGGLMARGAKMEEVPTKNGSIMLLTSTDAAVVADIHKWVKRNDEEMKKMMSAAPEK